MRQFIPLILMLTLVLMPSIIWLLLKQIHSPWWLENTVSITFIILVIYSVLMLMLINYLSYVHCIVYFLINFLLALLFNNISNFNRITIFNNQACVEPVTFFQFNIKYTESELELDELIAHLIAGQYHLITLQGVSRQSKQELIERLSTYYPYFIRGDSDRQQVYSDQLLFSRYAFSNLKFYKSGHSAYLISSQWQLPFSEINLYTLHPPSPRNEKLWQTRNKTLYQLKHALKTSQVKSSISKKVLVIGDINLSKHSNRIRLLKQDMHTKFVNSWPNKRYILPAFALAIDHFWVTKPANICSRQRISKFSWSDHYAVKTQVNFKK